ncbi:hypothetical protein N7509_008035 [Penicillium cosmopolitanum]|uniref:Uncharacterized protein n=1 Tax=Penicillium cosmopolitanum TaxID=1131564 RepID=A0A9W9W064_9EURO|nr:uncharacterized protein N7509_008035 [Penicillium cosmopolitanum]KAJ5392545.1 hypothetical protein N7509_008035 [Penicillium cosmopolitanum]
MSGIDMNHYGLYLAFSGRSDQANVHWMILLAHPGADRCMRFHCEGSPALREYVSESDTPFNGLRDSAYRRIDRKDLICRIPIEAFDVVVKQAEATPLQSSAFWVLYLLFRLERKGLVPEGTYTDWMTYYLTQNGDDKENIDAEDQGPGNLWLEEE